jgi:serine/threonine-protein kinase SRK2
MSTYKRYVGREVLNQSILRHPFIVELKEVFLTPQHLAIVMEFAQGGNMHK